MTITYGDELGVDDLALHYGFLEEESAAAAPRLCSADAAALKQRGAWGGAGGREGPGSGPLASLLAAAERETTAEEDAGILAAGGLAPGAWLAVATRRACKLALAAALAAARAAEAASGGVGVGGTLSKGAGEL